MPSQTDVMAAGPSGFDSHYVLATSRADCRIGVGFDTERGTVQRFLVQLELRRFGGDGDWTQIARVDHNPTSFTGHVLRSEGVHVDIVRPGGDEARIHPTDRRPSGRGDLGGVIDVAVEYFRRHPSYFVRVYRGEIEPSDPPNWP